MNWKWLRFKIKILQLYLRTAAPVYALSENMLGHVRITDKVVTWMFTFTFWCKCQTKVPFQCKKETKQWVWFWPCAESFFQYDCSCCAMFATAPLKLPRQVSEWTTMSEQDLANETELRAGNRWEGVFFWVFFFGGGAITQAWVMKNVFIGFNQDEVSIASWPAGGGGGPRCSKAAPSHFFCSPAQWLPAAVLRSASPPSTPLPPAASQSSPLAPPAFSPSNGSAWRRPPNSQRCPSLSFSRFKEKPTTTKKQLFYYPHVLCVWMFFLYALKTLSMFLERLLRCIYGALHYQILDQCICWNICLRCEKSLSKLSAVFPSSDSNSPCWAQRSVWSLVLYAISPGSSDEHQPGFFSSEPGIKEIKNQ